MSVKMKTKVKSVLEIKTKLALFVLTATALSFGVSSFAIMSVNFSKLVRPQKTLLITTSTNVSGQIQDILSGQSLSNVNITFTNTADTSEIYSANVDSNGNYQLLLNNVGAYNIYVDYGDEQYYDYRDFYVQINNFPFIYNVDLLPYEDYDMEASWDCNSEFNITEGDFPLITYIDRYYELIDIFLNTGTLTQLEWDELVVLKFASNDSIKSELEIINNNVSNQLYLDDQYASILFDKVLCNYRTEIDFFYKLQGASYPYELYPINFINTEYAYEFSILDVINEIITANPNIVVQQLLDNQAVEKISSILEWQTKFSSEGDKINIEKPWSFWNNYLPHVALMTGEVLYPNTERRLMLFYTNGIDDLLSILINLAEYSDKELIADIFDENNIFEKNYDLMTLPSIHDATMPSYRIKVINRNSDLLNIMYPYMFENSAVQNIIKWNNANKNTDGFFWKYLSTPKSFYFHEQGMIDISNLFNNLCVSTSTTALNGYCSPMQPAYCNNGEVINNCDTCGCVKGVRCSDSGYCTMDELPDINISR